LCAEHTLNIEKYIIDTDHLDLKRIQNNWKWLIGEDKSIIVLTKMGDLLIKDESGKLYFMSTEEGTLENISNYYTDFFKNKLSAIQYFEIFQPDLIDDLERDGKYLKEGQVYAFLKLPAMGGQKSLENIHCKDLYEHFDLTGEVHRQLDDLAAKKFLANNTE
jgi:hypothetical protein